MDSLVLGAQTLDLHFARLLDGEHSETPNCDASSVVYLVKVNRIGVALENMLGPDSALNDERMLSNMDDECGTLLTDLSVIAVDSLSRELAVLNEKYPREGE